MSKHVIQSRRRRNRPVGPSAVSDLVPAQPSLAARRLLAKFRLSLPVAELLVSHAGFAEKGTSR